MEKSEFEQLKEKIKINFLQIEKILAKYDDRLKDAERELVRLGDVKIRFEELDKKLDDFKKDTDAKIDAIKEEISSLKEISELKDKLPEMNKWLEEIRKNINEWKTFEEELNKNKNMYIKLREAVISSVEHLKEKENTFNKNIEELAIIAKKLEENEKAYEKMSSEINIQISALKEDYRRVWEEIKNLKSELAHIGNIKIPESENKIDESKKEVIYEEIDKIIDKLEKEIIPKKIDECMNSIITVINEKFKNFVALNKFEEFRNEINNRIGTLREPKVKNLEEKINEIEKDITEIKELIRNFSSRLPIVVE